jgi:hypothetical protein
VVAISTERNKEPPHLAFVREGVIVMMWQLSGVVVSERGGCKGTTPG